MIFIAKSGQRTGPFTIEQVADLIRKGEYSMGDLAWREGMAQWTPIHQITDLAAAVLPPIPVAPQNCPPEPPPLPNEPAQPAPPAWKPAGLENPSSDKLRIPAIMLCLFLGLFGIHAFYVGKNKQGASFIGAFLFAFFSSSLGASINSEGLLELAGAVYLVLFLACIVNAIRIAQGNYKDGTGRSITKWI
jgi:TM2 domain-containing membrane protein YozV